MGMKPLQEVIKGFGVGLPLTYGWYSALFPLLHYACSELVLGIPYGVTNK